LVPVAGFAQTAKAKKPGAASAKTTRPVLETNVRAEMNYLAGDALQGRGSGTENELKAGEYIASQFKKFGVSPAGDKTSDGKAGFIQTVHVTTRSYLSAPVLTTEGGNWSGTHGKEIAIVRAGSTELSAPLQKLQPGDKVKAGAFVYIHLGQGKADAPVRSQINAPLREGAAGVIIADSEQIRRRFKAAGGEMPELPPSVEPGESTASEGATIILGEEATKRFDETPDGTTVSLKGEIKTVQGRTWNVLGVLNGTDRKQSKEAILLSAHMDHLGVDPKLPGDQIFNGADDDASGVIAVLELARALGSAPKPKRTIYFALFGSEEKASQFMGGYGAEYFLRHPPIPLTDMAANLEFEMIGRPDSAVEAQTLWLTGYDRSNLGPELAKHGARLVADPHPDQNFFMRSDNYALARKGVVAQTVSSFGLHTDYHQVSDEISKIDFAHMTRAINSMVEPIIWLVNSDFTPQWLDGKKP
jgi:hypothetical protein